MQRREYLTFAGATLADAAVVGGLDYPKPGADESSHDLVFDPYAGVDWADARRLKTQLHSHTVNDREGGLDAHVLVDAHAARGYDALAITDKSKSPHVWPWEAFDEVETRGRAGEWEPRDPDEVGMVAIEGAEQTNHHHLLSLFCRYDDRRAPEPENAVGTVDGIGAAGGIAIVPHPAFHDDWSGVDDYAPFFGDRAGEGDGREHCLGLEAYHGADDSGEDEALWDGLVADLAPRRPVFGFAVDDGVSYDWGRDFDRYWIDVFAAAASADGVREALEAGAFTATQRDGWRPDGDEGGPAEPPTVPSVDSVAVDHDAAEISVDAVNYREVEWIADGDVIGTGETFGWADEGHAAALDAANYVRAKLVAESALTATQPFLFER